MKRPRGQPRRGGRRYLLRLVTVAALLTAVAVGFYSQRAPILSWVGRQLVHADPLDRSDAIVILSGGSFEREIEAADLYLAHYAPQVVLTTVREPRSLGELRRRGVRIEGPMAMRRRYLTELGVPAAAIVVLEEPVRSTAEEAALVAHWAETRRVRSVIIVTSSYHTGRSRFAFQRALRGSGIAIRLRPATFSGFEPDHWWQERGNLLTGIMETQKLVFYRLRYW